MRIAVGLGNPGSEYEGTRHNIGFDIVEAVARTLGMQFRPGRGEYIWAKGMLGVTPVALVKPLTYMNNSGIAVGEIAYDLGVPVGDFLIVLDDFHLPLGTIRLRRSGSDGGHNGLSSVIYQMQTEEVPRLRCGIRGSTMPVRKEEYAAYVLSTFEPDERAAVEDCITRSGNIVLSILGNGMTQPVAGPGQ